VRFGLDASDGAEAMALASSETLAERASALLGMLGRYALPRPIGRAARHLGAVLPDAPSTFNPRALPRGPDPN